MLGQVVILVTELVHFELALTDHIVMVGFAGWLKCWTADLEVPGSGAPLVTVIFYLQGKLSPDPKSRVEKDYLCVLRKGH